MCNCDIQGRQLGLIWSSEDGVIISEMHHNIIIGKSQAGEGIFFYLEKKEYSFLLRFMCAFFPYVSSVHPLSPENS